MAQFRNNLSNNKSVDKRQDSFIDFEERKSTKQNKSYKAPRVISFCIIVLITLGVLVYNSGYTQPKLGLDLRGGTTIVLQPLTSEIGKITSESTSQAVSILRQRVDGVGVSESDIHAEGSGVSTKIIVSVPGTTERELVGLVGQTAKLSIRPVLFAGINNTNNAITFPSDIPKAAQDEYLKWNCATESTSSRDNADQLLIACDKPGVNKFILATSDVEGSQIESAQSTLDQGSLGWVTNIIFNDKGKTTFGDLTTSISKLPTPRNQMAIVLDGKVVTAPRVDGPITGGSVIIYGSFTQKYAQELANILKYGALPFSFKVNEVQQISASLGATQLKSGLIAGLLGLLLISIYLLFYYRALGILAIGSLLIAFIMTYSIFIVLGGLIGLTLSLAGIAGAIVSIGVTADSFIVYFERVRDELRMGTSLRLALIKGWLRAKRTILIADAVSLLAALVLYVSTTGNVRGFAFTLGLTTLLDLFIIYFFTRPLLVLLQNMNFFKQGHHLSGLSQESLGIVSNEKRKRLFDLAGLGGRLYRGESSIGIVDRPRRWFIFSGALILASTISLSIVGINLGLEFKGGSVNTVTTSQPSSEKAREALRASGYKGEATVQVVGKDKVRIETTQLTNEEANKLALNLAQKFNVDVATIDSQSVGPSWGAEISHKALNGLIWFIILLTIYLSFALDIRMGAAALVAVLHDVFITIGLYSATGLKITPSAAIGFLTILGYSLYDTVVVFDKVRENVGKIKRRSHDEYKKAVDLALNQTLIRSINTSIVAIIPIFSILIIGAIVLKAETLKDISLALVVGQTIGTYSSIFIAAPLLVKFNLKKNNQSTRNNEVTLVPRSATDVSSKSSKDKTGIELDSWSALRIQKNDGPDLFKLLYEENKHWENLWIDEEISLRLEDFGIIISKEIAKNDTGINIMTVKSHHSNKIIALIELEIDLVNTVCQLKILTVFENQEKELTEFIYELHQKILTMNMAHMFVWIYDSEPNSPIKLTPYSDSNVRLIDAFRTRSGRCDAIIYKCKIDSNGNT